MGKRGYFFMMDAFLGIAIMLASAAYFYSIHYYEQPKGQLNLLTENMMGFLADSKVVGINNNYRDTLIANGNITNAENTIIEQVNEFEYREKRMGCAFCFNLSRNLLANLTHGVVEDRYNYQISLNGRVVYEKVLLPESASTVTLKSSRLVYTLINGSEMYGPSYAELAVWQ